MSPKENNTSGELLRRFRVCVLGFTSLVAKDDLKFGLVWSGRRLACSFVVGPVCPVLLPRVPFHWGVEAVYGLERTSGVYACIIEYIGSSCASEELCWGR